MYYGVIMIAVLMFSLQFVFNQAYEKDCGSGMRAMLVFTLGSGLAGLLVLLIVNRFRLEFTPFTLAMSCLVALNSLAYSYCSLKAFAHINLSLYSVFSMLGGMALPFVAGIAFFHEPLTWGKTICVLLVAASLFFTIRGERKSGAVGYYIGIFVLNGISGVISKCLQAAPWEKTSSAGFSILSAAVTVVLALLLLPFTRSGKKTGRLTLRAGGSMLGYGVLNRIGNFLLLIALEHLPASVQYPMITGGVMIFSTVFTLLGHNRPGRKEMIPVWISLILSFIGIAALIAV